MGQGQDEYLRLEHEMRRIDENVKELNRLYNSLKKKEKQITNHDARLQRLEAFLDTGCLRYIFIGIGIGALFTLGLLCNNADYGASLLTS